MGIFPNYIIRLLRETAANDEPALAPRETLSTGWGGAPIGMSSHFAEE